MTRTRVFTLTCLAMLAFAGNSLLARAALARTVIDAASFTTIRLVSGAVVLWLIVSLKSQAGRRSVAGNWLSGFALFAYAACFSFAYLGLSTATGALLLFGAVQVTMIGWGLAVGERFTAVQWLGLLLAAGGLVALLLPGLSAPPLQSAVLMLAAGVAWGLYSIRGKGTPDALAATAGNFLRSVIFTLVLSAAWQIGSATGSSVDASGVSYAIASGALASGVGYTIWYSALRGLASTVAATVQLSVPPLAAIAGVLFLGEAVTLRLALAATVILGGIALVILNSRRAST